MNTQQHTTRSKSGARYSDTMSKHTQKCLALFLSTLVDCPEIIHPEDIDQGPKQRQISLLCAYELIQEYERRYMRAYPEQLRFYILASMIDQGLINFAAAEPKSRQARCASQWMVYNIQMLQQQFHKQSLSLEYLLKSIGQPELSLQKKAYRLFEILDDKCCGSAHLEQIHALLATFNPDIDADEFKEAHVIAKLTNNVRYYDQLAGTLMEEGRKYNKDLFHIENFLELVNRVQAVDASAGIFECRQLSITYLAIGLKLQRSLQTQQQKDLMEQYESVKSAVRQAERNSFKDELSGIKNTSRQIVELSKATILDGMNTAKKHQLEQTNTFSLYTDNYLSNQDKFTSTGDKINQNNLYLENFRTGDKDFRTNQISFRTSETPKATTARIISKHESAQQNRKFLLSRLSKINPLRFSPPHTPQILHTPHQPILKTVDQNIQVQLPLEPQKQYIPKRPQSPEKRISRQQMRKRIEQEIQLISRQRIKNRFKYYQAVFP